MIAPRAWLVLLVSLAACGGPPETAPPPAPKGVNNAALGVAFVVLPAGWEEVQNLPEGLRLRRDGGEVAISVGVEEPAGVNLVAAVERRQREIEAAGGSFAGSKELITPWGPAFTARGRFPGAAGEVEELTVLALHPAGWNRPLVAAYRYAVEEGATARRSRELLELLAEVEPTPEGGSVDPR